MDTLSEAVKKERKVSSERRRKERIKNDPLLYEIHKQKDRERYAKRKAEGKVKKMSERPRREQNALRKYHREHSKKSYYKKKSNLIKVLDEKPVLLPSELNALNDLDPLSALHTLGTNSPINICATEPLSPINTFTDSSVRVSPTISDPLISRTNYPINICIQKVEAQSLTNTLSNSAVPVSPSISDSGNDTPPSPFSSECASSKTVTSSNFSISRLRSIVLKDLIGSENNSITTSFFRKYKYRMSKLGEAEKKERKIGSERRRKERIKNDPLLYEIHKQKDRERYAKRKAEGKVKKMSERPRREQNALRKYHREHSKKSYCKKKRNLIKVLDEKPVLLPSELNALNDLDPLIHTLGTNSPINICATEPLSPINTFTDSSVRVSPTISDPLISRTHEAGMNSPINICITKVEAQSLTNTFSNSAVPVSSSISDSGNDTPPSPFSSECSSSKTVTSSNFAISRRLRSKDLIGAENNSITTSFFKTYKYRVNKEFKLLRHKIAELERKNQIYLRTIQRLRSQKNKALKELKKDTSESSSKEKSAELTKRFRRTSVNVKEVGVDFYEDDENSRSCPGKRDYGVQSKVHLGIRSEGISKRAKTNMDVSIELEMESDSDGNASLPLGSEEECRVPKTEATEEHVLEVSMKHIGDIKCEYESDPEHDDELRRISLVRCREDRASGDRCRRRWR